VLNGKHIWVIMSHVLSFYVSGLNGRHKPVSYEVDRHINVFFGPNGSGKTSILKILDSAMSDDATTVASTSFADARVLIYSLQYTKEVLLTYKKTPSSHDEKTDIAVEIETSEVFLQEKPSRSEEPAEGWKMHPELIAPGTRRRRQWAHLYLPTSRLYMDRHQIADEMYFRSTQRGRVKTAVIEDNLDKNFASSLQILWRTKFSDILGRVRTIQQDALQNIFLDALAPEGTERPKRDGRPVQQRSFDADRAFERMSSFLKRQSDKRVRQALGSKDTFSKRYARETRLRHIVNQIDLVESRIESEMKPVEEFSGLIKRLFISGKSISFDGPQIVVETDDHEVIGLERLSSGEKHLIRILIAAIDAGDSTLLIDEPELSLHIDWQRELISNIRTLNPNCQLIFATHSPEIMTDIPDRNIFPV
jgi:predicted ATPase